MGNAWATRSSDSDGCDRPGAAGIRAIEASRLVALVSGDRLKQKSSRINTQYGRIPSTDYADYNQLADNPEVEAVYIALPNSMHAEYTIRAARAGKHVLCEKPMAVSVKHARR